MPQASDGGVRSMKQEAHRLLTMGSSLQNYITEYKEIEEIDAEIIRTFAYNFLTKKKKMTFTKTVCFFALRGRAASK